MVAKASLKPGTLLLLPEMFATGFTMNAKGMAERVDGPTAQFLAEQAQRHQIFVQAGLVLADDQGGKPRNETLVFNPHGRQIARYAKMHLFSYARAPEYYSPGAALATFRFHGAVAAPKQLSLGVWPRPDPRLAHADGAGEARLRGAGGGPRVRSVAAGACSACPA